MDSWLANTAEEVITPPPGVHLLEPRGQPATGVYDDLFVRALALSDGQTTIAIVAMDLVGLDLDLVQQVQQAIQARCSLPVEHTMLTTTHTHSAPVTIKWDHRAQPMRDRGWESAMTGTVAGCVARACQGLVPVSLAAGRADVQIGFNRRISSPGGTRMDTNPAGPVAPWVDVLRVDREDGTPLAVLFSHAAHPVAVHVADTRFTADYPGAAVETIRQSLGGRVTPMFAQGCCGDINVDPLAGGYAEARRVGAILGEAAVVAAQTAQRLAPAPLHVAVDNAILPFERLEPAVVDDLLARARESYAAAEGHGASDSELNDQRELLLWAEAMKRMVESADPPQGLPFRVQGFAVGHELAILGLSHELFVEHQLFLQGQSPFPRTMVFGYANGCADYVPTAAALLLGGYEVQGGPKEYGMPPLRLECERIVRETGMRVLQQLWDIAPGGWHGTV